MTRGLLAYLACCLIAVSPLMSWRENLAAWALLGMAWSLAGVRKARA